MGKYEPYRKHINFIKRFTASVNPASGSEVDANSNVSNKNIATMAPEIHKKDNIYTNRLWMHDKIKEMYGQDLADEYIRQLEEHEVYRHDESGMPVGTPYCASITLYPFLFEGMETIGGTTKAPKRLRSFVGGFINLVFAISAQLCGAVSTPEFLSYMDYFIRKEYGDDYYLRPDNVVDLSAQKHTIDSTITGYFEQAVYSLNQPAAARGSQSVFWNIAYFDKYYFNQLFEGFVFPDGTSMQWESVSWLQKRFMMWLNKERTRNILTFPVETLSLLNDGAQFMDKEWAEFAAEMYAEGHSFFTYTSYSVDSLASCCFHGSQMTLTKSSNGVKLMSFKDLYNSKYMDTRIDFEISHNGCWRKGDIIREIPRKMYKITTSNKKTLLVTDNHVHLTFDGEKKTEDLKMGDYLLFNTLPLAALPEADNGYSYEEGFLIGMYLGKGDVRPRSNDVMVQAIISLDEREYDNSIDRLNVAANILCNGSSFSLNESYDIELPSNNFDVHTSCEPVIWFIQRYIKQTQGSGKELNMDVLLQSREFRVGILDGYCETRGSTGRRIYCQSEYLTLQMEALLTSLGMHSVIGKDGCITWYAHYNMENAKSGFIKSDNSIYFKITSIEECLDEKDWVYCFQMNDENEPYFTLPNGVVTHNCRLRNAIQDNTFSYTLGAGGVATGSKCVMTINVNRLVQNAVKSNTDLTSAITEQVEKVHKYLTAFNEILYDMCGQGMLPLYDAGFVTPEKQYLTIGLNGLIEGAEFLGIEISDNEKYAAYVSQIMEPIYRLNREAKTSRIMFNTELVPAENLGVKNSTWDKKDGYHVPRDCYNSYFYKVEDPTVNVIDKFHMHGSAYAGKLDGGSALHVNLDEHLSKDQYVHLMNVAIRTGCNYFTFNVPNTVCNKCKHISKHKLDRCSQCGSDNLDYATRIIGYLTLISKWSEERKRESEKRHYHKPAIHDRNENEEINA